MSEIDSTPPILSKLIRVESRSEENPLGFRLGETLLGRVVEQIDQHHAILQIKGYDLLVESHISLSKNMEGLFQVEATYPQIVLRRIPEGEVMDPADGAWIRKYLSFDFPSGNLSEKLSNLWDIGTKIILPQMRDKIEPLLELIGRFSIEEPFSLNPDRLQEIVNQSGLFFEHKLKNLIQNPVQGQWDQWVMGDFKGLLVRLISQLKSLPPQTLGPGDDGHGLDEMVSGLDQILHKIEGYQILNLDPSNPYRLFLLLPFWFQRSLQLVELNISLPHKDPHESHSEETSILFLLCLPEWGKMSIEVKMKGKGLSCRFKVSDPEVSAFLKAAFPELNERLDRVGFQPQLTISTENPENILQAWFHELEGEVKSLLNVVV